MKLYDYHRAPNPRRVRIFSAEKGIELEKVEIDLGSKQQMEAEYKSLNSRLSVPALELDDGSVLTESVAICRYLEELQSEPILFGTGAFGKATVEMWHRRVKVSQEWERERREVEEIRAFAQARPDVVRAQLISTFELSPSQVQAYGLSAPEALP